MLLQQSLGLELLKRTAWWLKWGRSEQRVSLGSHELSVIVGGQGPLAIVFESGAGDTMDVWAKVQPRIAKNYVTVLYERAGIGSSTESPNPKTSFNKKSTGTKYKKYRSTGTALLAQKVQYRDSPARSI